MSRPRTADPDIADSCVDAARTRQLDHARRLVESDDLGAELGLHTLRKLTLAAADLENPLRGDLDDRPEHDLTRVGARDVRVDSLSRGEPGLSRILLADKRRIVGRDRHSSIGRPGSRLPGALPPSHEFTVAPTSANSPSSWILPAAFRPAA